MKLNIIAILVCCYYLLIVNCCCFSVSMELLLDNLCNFAEMVITNILQNGNICRIGENVRFGTKKPDIIETKTCGFVWTLAVLNQIL